MGISLKKGQGVSLKKNDDDLSLVTIGLGWDVKETKKGLFGGIFGKKEVDYDLDVIAFLCEADGKIHNLGDTIDGKPTLKNGDIVFFNSMNHHSGHILFSFFAVSSKHFCIIGARVWASTSPVIVMVAPPSTDESSIPSIFCIIVGSQAHSH